MNVKEPVKVASIYETSGSQPSFAAMDAPERQGIFGYGEAGSADAVMGV